MSYVYCRCSDSPRAEASGVCGGILSNDDSNADPSDLTIVASPTASDKDVDITVEQTCEKIHLTATNVRSIIRVSVFVSAGISCLDFNCP